MKKTLLVACMLAFAAGARADFGRKMLKKDNVTAVQKAAKAATLSDDDMKKLSLQSVAAMDEQNPAVPDGRRSVRAVPDSPIIPDRSGADR